MKEKASCEFRTSIGGQALIEGILMRGPKKQAIVCRTAEGLVEKTEELKFIKDRYPILGWPLIRGCAIFLSSMVNGMQALTYSANLVPLEQQGEPDKLDRWIEAHFPEDKAQKLIIGVAVVMGIALSLFLFIFLPAFLVGLIPPLRSHLVARNLAEGAVRIVILLSYILVNSVVRLQNSFARMGAHLLLLPLVVGISYEINRWCGLHDNALSAFLSAPGKWLQHITTNEPDDSMIECAIRALQLVIPEEKGSDAWGN